MFGDDIFEKPEKKDLKRPKRNNGDGENEESPLKKSKAIKISISKDWKPPIQKGRSTSVKSRGWNFYVQKRGVKLIFHRELYEKNTSVFGKYDSFIKNAKGIDREEKLQAFKISVLTDNKQDAIKRYLEALQMILGSYVYLTMIKILDGVLTDNLEIRDRDTFDYFGFDINRKIRQRRPISNLRDLILQRRPIINHEDLSSLFMKNYAIGDNLDFDLCVYCNILERTNYVFSREIQLLVGEMRKVRNEWAHNLNEDFWSNEKFEKRIEQIHKLCQKISRESKQDFSGIKRNRRDYMLERDFELFLKFGLSEKHTKFEKIFLMVLTNQLIYLVNVQTMRKIFSNFVCFSESPNFTYIRSKLTS